MNYKGIVGASSNQNFIEHAHRIRKMYNLDTWNNLINKVANVSTSMDEFIEYLDFEDIFRSNGYHFLPKDNIDSPRCKYGFCVFAEVIINSLNFYFASISFPIDGEDYEAKKIIKMLRNGLYSIDMTFYETFNEHGNPDWTHVISNARLSINPNSKAGSLYARYYDYHLTENLTLKGEIIGTLHRELEKKTRKSIETVFGKNSLNAFSKIANKGPRHKKNLDLTDNELLSLYDLSFNVGIGFFNFINQFPDYLTKIDLEGFNKK